MDLSNIEWLWFDLDDTLLPSSRYYDQALMDIGIDPNSKAYLEAKANAKANLGAEHVSCHSRLIYFKYWMSATDRYSSNALLQLYESYCDRLTSYLSAYVEKHQVFSRVLSLKTKYRIGVVTNETLHMQTRKILALDPKGDLFDFVVTSEEAGAEKPHKQIFQVALDRSKTQPDRVLMIGDSWKADILGARSFGMRAVYAGTDQSVKPADAAGKATREDIFNVLECL